MHKLNDMQIIKMRTEEEDKYLKKNREEQVISCAERVLAGVRHVLQQE